MKNSADSWRQTGQWMRSGFVMDCRSNLSPDHTADHAAISAYSNFPKAVGCGPLGSKSNEAGSTRAASMPVNVALCLSARASLRSKPSSGGEFRFSSTRWRGLQRNPPPEDGLQHHCPSILPIPAQQRFWSLQKANDCGPEGPALKKAGSTPAFELSVNNKTGTMAGFVSGIWWRRRESNPRPQTI